MQNPEEKRPSGGPNPAETLPGYQEATDSQSHLVANRYEVVAKLGSGGMGAVYKVLDRENEGRTLALKITLEDANFDEVYLARFKREIAAIQKVQHPNIVKIYESDRDGNKLFFTMDYVEGVTLHSLLARKSLPLQRRIEIVAKVAAAVHAAHEQGIVHRDLKPANIIVRYDGEPILMDFGIAKVLEAHTRLTQSGFTLGTPYYMSPEQAMAMPDIDARSDIFSLGIILYLAVTNDFPFTGLLTQEILEAIIAKTPEPPSHKNKEVSCDLEAICLRALEKDKEMRYATALEFSQDLFGVATRQQVIPKPPFLFLKIRKNLQLVRKNLKLILINGLVLATLAVILWFVLRG